MEVLPIYDITDTEYALGVSLKQIAEEVVLKVLGIESISRKTIHCLMKPPHEKHCNAKRFKGCKSAMKMERYGPRRTWRYSLL